MQNRDILPRLTGLTTLSSASGKDPSPNSLSATHELDTESMKTYQVGAETIDHQDYPDGGLRAWLIIVGTMCCTFSTFGFVNSWGVFQSYYETHALKNSSPSQIAWIGSIQYSLVFLPAQIMGRLFDLGYFKIPFLFGTLLLVAATLLIAHCRVYWHFLLCQGFAVGLACGMCFGPTLSVVGHWFKKRRGLALGLSSAGTSIGGTTLPIATRNLIKTVGFPWAMRILGLILLFTLGIPNILLARRLPPKNVSGGLFNLKAFMMPEFTIYCFANTVAFLGIYTVLTFIDISAVNAGISPDFTFYLVSFANASTMLGRIMIGAVADRYGAVNVMTPMTIGAAAVTLAWPYAKDKASLIIIALLYGFTSSGYVAIFHMPVFGMGAIEDVGRRVGTVLVFAAVGAVVGPPISGAISAATGSVKAVSYYAGGTILLAVALMLTARHLILKSFYGKF